MQEKRGQVALYVLIAVVVVATLVIFLRPKKLTISGEQAKQLLSSKAALLKATMQDCAVKAASFCVYKLGKQAGYYRIDTLPYWYWNGPKVIVMYKDLKMNRINLLPSLDQITETEFDLCMQQEGNRILHLCWDPIKERESAEISIHESEPKLGLIAREKDLLVSIDWQLDLSKQALRGTEHKTIKASNESLDIPLRCIYDWVNELVNAEINQLYSVTELSNFLRNKPYSAWCIDTIDSQQISEAGRDITIYLVKATKPAKNPFEFYFAIDRTAYEFKT